MAYMRFSVLRWIEMMIALAIVVPWLVSCENLSARKKMVQYRFGNLSPRSLNPPLVCCVAPL